MSTRFGRESVLATGTRRGLALAATAVLIGSYLAVCLRVTDIAGGTERLLLFVGCSLLAATVLARFLPAVVALVLAVALFGVGLWSYVLAVPNGELLLRSLGAVRTDILSLLTGLSILRIMEAGIWAAGFAPAPTFLAWYFALRRRYVAAAAVGSAALGFFVLTGDASTTVVLAGVVGAAGVVGFGELDRYDGRPGHAEALVVVLAAMVVFAPLVSVVPSGASDPLVPSGGGGGTNTVEASLLAAGDRVRIQGSISLSPKVRFVVESNRPSYWRVAAYDRYTGNGWIRTGDDRPTDGSLPAPPGNTTTIQQSYEMKAPVGIMPTAWKPVEFSGVPTDVRVTDLGGLQPVGALTPGDTYAVESQRPVWAPDELRAAGRDYPDRIVERYTQLPESTPDRVARATARLTRRADNPYDTARTIERWLEQSKGYSLDVDRPEGNIASNFIFEMERGYCVYFATTMVVMLRTQGIPARFVTGYATGQRVAEDKWVVRGYDSHAWVEVYFPDVGWVRFDPTPAGPRSAREQASLEEARANNRTGIDAASSEEGVWTPTPTPTPIGTNRDQSGTNDTPSNPGPVRNPLAPGLNGPNAPRTPRGGMPSAGGAGATVTPVGGSSGAIPSLPSPSREQLAFGLVALAGLVAVARRSGAAERIYRALWVRYQPTDSPTAEVEHAFERLEYLLGRRYRPRRQSETPREYLSVVGDGRAARVGALFERAHYAGSVTRAEADEASRLLRELVRERTPVLGWFRRAR